MLDQRRSFSFSSFDFNSSNNSTRLFSSSSDDDFFASNFIMYDTDEDNDDDDDDGSYIEININPPQKIVVELEKESNNNSNSSDQVELRISFSSSTGIPPIEKTKCGSSTQHAQGATTTMTTKTRRGRIFESLSRIVNEFITASSAKTSNSVRAIEANNNNVAREHGPTHLPPLSKSGRTEMIRNRKDCTMVASKNNGIMNFIVKLKYKNIQSMLLSMVTPKAKNGQPLLQRWRSSSCPRRDPMNNNNNNTMKLKTRNHSNLDNHQDLNRDISKSSSSVAGIVNFKAMRGVLDALIVKTSRYCTSTTTITGGALLSGKKQNKSKSCPSSIKSSPMHSNVCDEDVRRFNSRDNSIQAAIAHCKKSFGTQAEFDFHL